MREVRGRGSCHRYYERVPIGSIQQINISKGGIPKLPVAEALVTPLGIQGDSHAHPQIHGGPRQALLLISWEGIDELIEAGFPLSPCNTLRPYGAGIHEAIYDPQVKAKDHSSPRWGLSGLYARVVNPGRIFVGDPIALLDELA